MTEPHATASTDLVATSLDVIAAGQTANGAILAGPTFSQYGYSWFRDGAFVAEALDSVGRLEDAARFHHWIAGIVRSRTEALERARSAGRAGRVPDAADYLHCRYAPDGSTGREDWPNFQLDGPGIWLWSLSHHLRHGGTPDADAQAAVELVARYLADLWEVPSADAWEEYDSEVHTSTLAAIAAGLDAAVGMVPALAADPTVARALDSIPRRMAVLDGAYTKWAGNPEVDASLLWMAAPYELVAPSDERFAATLRRIEDELVTPGPGLHRYRSDTFYGGGAWPVLTAAYGRVLLRRDGPGDLERAIEALRWIEAQADEAGLLPEQTAAHAFAPERVDEWREAWGDNARPLLWSHATYLSLRSELASRVELPDTTA